MPSNKQRREAARRHLERQLQRREQRDRSRRRVALILSIVGTLALVAVIVVWIVAVGDDHKKPAAAGSSPPTTPSTSASTSKPPGSCSFAPAQNATRNVKRPPSTVPATGLVTVNVHTNRGDMTFRLNRDKAPCTVASFVSLVQQKFYDNTPCHRLTTTGIYVLQCGDPSGTGSGGPGYTVPDEYVGSEFYKAGTIAMANNGQPNSGGSQFFICYKESPLPRTYTVFGTVSTGMSVVNTVAAGGSDNSTQPGDGHPKLKITFEKLTLS